MAEAVEMTVVYALEEPPQRWTRAIFLAGPTPRAENPVPSWRPEALELLAEAGYDGVVFVPEPRSGQWPHDYTNQIEWEERCLHLADCILFWVPRDLVTLPAFTTNVEFGYWMSSGKIVFGAPQVGTTGEPKELQKNAYLTHYVHKLGIPRAVTLENTVSDALLTVDSGSERTGGEREVPLYIWRTDHFQDWYRTQRRAGNRLDGARVVWTFRSGPRQGVLFFWALHVKMYVTAESRHKTNEVVISRPDIVSTVLYRRQYPLLDSEVVLIREYRVPSVSTDGCVWELPGGSSFVHVSDQLDLAHGECTQETGLYIEPSRFRYHGTRQLLATVSAHRGHLFSVELTDGEVDVLLDTVGTPFGVAEDTERTYAHVVTLRDIYEQRLVDWSMLGMISQVLAAT